MSQRETAQTQNGETLIDARHFCFNLLISRVNILSVEKKKEEEVEERIGAAQWRVCSHHDKGRVKG